MCVQKVFYQAEIFLMRTWLKNINKELALEQESECHVVQVIVSMV